MPGSLVRSVPDRGASRGFRGPLRAAVVAALGCGALLAPPAGAFAQDTVTLPSGRVVTFNEVVHNTQGSTGRSVRFRFLEADLAAVVEAGPYGELEADMQYLCETYALPRISNIGPRPAQIVISIADRPVVFGASDPEATQVFEAYRPEGGACIWEGF